MLMLNTIVNPLHIYLQSKYNTNAIVNICTCSKCGSEIVANNYNITVHICIIFDSGAKVG